MLREGLISEQDEDGHSVFSLFKSVALGFVCLSTSAASPMTTLASRRMRPEK